LLRLVANQLKVGIESWDEYGQREQTRREHLVELQTVFGFQPFTIGHYRQAVQLLTELAMQTDKGIVLARADRAPRAVGHCARPQRRRAGERRSDYRANRPYDALAADGRIAVASTICSSAATTARYVAGPGCGNPRQTELAHMLEHIERLGVAGARPASGIERLVHQNRLLDAGGRPDDARRPGEVRAAAATIWGARIIEGMATVTDEIIDLHDRILASCSMPPRTSISSSSRHPARRSTPRCGCSARRALIEAKQAAAIRSPPSRLSCPGCCRERHRSAAARATRGLRFPHRIGESYATLRRYAPEFLDVLKPGRARRQGRTRRHRGAAQHEQRQRPQGAHRRADRVHQAALAEAGDDRYRHRPALLRTVRAVGA
jgi:hypothetical protein